MGTTHNGNNSYWEQLILGTTHIGNKSYWEQVTLARMKPWEPQVWCIKAHPLLMYRRAESASSLGALLSTTSTLLCVRVSVCVCVCRMCVLLSPLLLAIVTSACICAENKPPFWCPTIINCNVCVRMCRGCVCPNAQLLLIEMFVCACAEYVSALMPNYYQLKRLCAHVQRMCLPSCPTTTNWNVCVRMCRGCVCPNAQLLPTVMFVCACAEDASPLGALSTACAALVAKSWESSSGQVCELMGIKPRFTAGTGTEKRVVSGGAIAEFSVYYLRLSTATSRCKRNWTVVLWKQRGFCEWRYSCCSMKMGSLFVNALHRAWLGMRVLTSLFRPNRPNCFAGNSERVVSVVCCCWY